MFALRPKPHPNLMNLKESFRELLGALSVEEIVNNRPLSDLVSRVHSSFSSMDGGTR
jgi:hypothetical protein